MLCCPNKRGHDTTRVVKGTQHGELNAKGISPSYLAQLELLCAYNISQCICTINISIFLTITLSSSTMSQKVDATSNYSIYK